MLGNLLLTFGANFFKGKARKDTSGFGIDVDNVIAIN